MLLLLPSFEVLQLRRTGSFVNYLAAAVDVSGVAVAMLLLLSVADVRWNSIACNIELV